MRELAINTFLTLDGVMQAPGGPEEDPSGGFAFGGWSVNYWDAMMGELMDGLMAQPFDLLLGRKTYEIFAAHWPYAEEASPADSAGDALEATARSAVQIMNETRKYVASRTLDRLTWQNSELLRGDAVAAVSDLKREDGPQIQVHGSSGLIQTLLAAGLVDLWRIWTFPLVVGRGKRLFGEGTRPAALKLVDAKTSTSGVVIATYLPAGPVEPGSFAIAEPTEAEIARRRKVADEG